MTALVRIERPAAARLRGQQDMGDCPLPVYGKDRSQAHFLPSAPVIHITRRILMPASTNLDTLHPPASAESGRKSIRRLPRAQRVGDIEAAAREVFSRCGYAGASIEEIAAEAGVAEGTIYKFFDSKRHLVLHVIERWYDEMLAQLEQGLRGISGTRNKIRFIVWHHLSSLQDNKELARLCANEVRNSGDTYQTELRDLNRRYTHVFLEVCREGIANGELRPDMPLTVVRALTYGGMEYQIAPVLYGPVSSDAKIDVDTVAELIVDILMRAVERAPVPNPDADRLTRLEESVARIERAITEKR